MGFFQWFFFLCVILIHHYDLITAQTNLCGGASYSNNSPFDANLNILLSSLSSNTTLGFFNTTIGQNSPDDKAYGLLLCRGDVSTEVCKNCVEIVSKNITQLCPNKKEAIIWDEKCMLRYSDQSFFSTMQDTPTEFVDNPNNNSNPNEFNRILVDLMDVLVRTAANGSTLKFATGDAYFTNSQKIYGLVQCTPDLSQIDCNTCLVGAVKQISICCNGKEGGRVLQPSCNLGFETFLFYDESINSVHITPSPPPPPSPSSPPLTNKTARKAKENSFPIVVVIVVPSIIAIALLSTITAYYCSRKRRAKEKVDEDVGEIISVESLQFGFDTIEAATDNFSGANKLGQGGFGAVYKGKLSNGHEIAVKRLLRNSGQGEEQFKNEVVLMAKLQHRNLVRLLGFCIEGQEKLLIYEFMPNTSLDHILFDPINRANFKWETRYKIIKGTARALLYLHEDSQHRIIHRDLKASNVLLDAEMNPKISDFGMARLFVMDQTQGNTSRVYGTYGYMPPEYVFHGRFSVKSDVYSFGVLLLEMAWRLWKEGTTLELIDPTLKDSFSTGEVIRCIHIGLLCVQEDVADRPTMASVVLMLNSYSVSLALPSRPAFVTHSSMVSDMPINNSRATVNEVSITE